MLSKNVAWRKQRRNYDWVEGKPKSGSTPATMSTSNTRRQPAWSKMTNWLNVMTGIKRPSFLIGWWRRSSEIHKKVGGGVFSRLASLTRRERVFGVMTTNRPCWKPAFRRSLAFARITKKSANSFHCSRWMNSNGSYAFGACSWSRSSMAALRERRTRPFSSTPRHLTVMSSPTFTMSSVFLTRKFASSLM